jgi:hypothetical protein
MYCIEYKLSTGEIKRTEPEEDFLKVARQQAVMIKENTKKTRKKKNQPESPECKYTLIQIIKV